MKFFLHNYSLKIYKQNNKVNEFDIKYYKWCKYIETKMSSNRSEQTDKFANNSRNRHEESIDDNQIFLDENIQKIDLSNDEEKNKVNDKCKNYNIIFLFAFCVVFLAYEISQVWKSPIEISETNILQKKNKTKDQQISDLVKQKPKVQQIINISWISSKNIISNRISEIIHPVKIEQNSLQLLNTSNIVQAQALLNSNMPAEYYAYTLYQNWQNKNSTIDLTQFTQLNRKYNISKQVKQRNICIISPFKNLIASPTTNSLPYYFQSLNNQNYSNFHVYIIDDASTDGSIQHILKQIKLKYYRLNNRLTIIRNNQSIGALANRDIVSRYFCQQNDIIMEVDADDCLIGKQTLKLYNKIYNDNPSIWFLYSNYIMKKVTQKNKPPKLGRNQQIKPYIHQTNTYRTVLKYWVTVHLRSYLRKLYTKIPIQYFLEKETKNYYLWASDRFNMYPLVELAGPDHTHFIPELLYYYNLPDDARRLRRNDCDVPMIRYQSTLSKLQTPLMPLTNLQMQAQITKNYQIPKQLIQFSNEKKKEYEKCLQQYKVSN